MLQSLPMWSSQAHDERRHTNGRKQRFFLCGNGSGTVRAGTGWHAWRQDKVSCIPIAQQLLSRIVRGRYVMEGTKNPLELNYRYTVAYKNFIPTSVYYNTVHALWKTFIPSSTDYNTVHALWYHDVYRYYYTLRTYKNFIPTFAYYSTLLCIANCKVLKK